MNTKISLAMMTCALCVSPSIFAVSLTEPPVSSFADFVINGTTSAARPELAGTVLEDVTTNFTISGAGESFSGQIRNRVVRSVDGTLDFYWLITPTEGTGDIFAFRVSGFNDITLDADWRSDGLGTVAPTVARYYGSTAGSVDFLFGTNQIGIGESSKFFFLDTQATSYSRTGQFELLCANTDCKSSSYSTFAPTAVPLPAAAWLFGSGLMGLIGISRRAKREHKHQ